MFDYDKREVVAISKSNNFLINNTEKVLRLTNVLNFVNKTEFGEYLCLKGGTAINLFLLDLSRLSVDIDYDFSLNCSKEEMLSMRKLITDKIINYMINDGYQLSDNSKYYHSLDSLVFSYFTTSGSNDNLKIEINYSNRVHVFSPILKTQALVLGKEITTNMLSLYDLIGSKINALINRTVPRDFYDFYNLLMNSKYDYNLLKKVVIFYLVVGSNDSISVDEKIKICFERINKIGYNKLRDTLVPLLHKQEKLDIVKMKQFVLSELEKMLVLNTNEKIFIEEFNRGNFNQQVLFEQYEVNDLSTHPMIIWKIEQHTK